MMPGPEPQQPQVLYVLAASYDSVEQARADFDAIRALYDAIKASDKFDAAVLSKNDQGKVHIDKTYEAGTRHDALRGLGWGLAAGTAAALFPAIGIGAALAVGGLAARRLARSSGITRRAWIEATSRSWETCLTPARPV